MEDHGSLDRLIPNRATVFRFAVFGTVAVGGLIVQLALLSVFYRLLSLHYVMALGLAVLLAMTFNFAVHNVFTFGDRKLKGLDQVMGWLSFCFASAFGGVLNMAVATFLYTIGWNWALSGLLGAAAGGLVNFGLASRYTWKPGGR